MRISRFLFIIGTLFFSTFSFSKECKVSDAMVTQVHQYKDGTIFINVDKINNCGCPQQYRMAFHKLEDEKFFISAALTALTTGKKVSLVGDDADGNCPVHGNTAKLKSFYINKN